MRTVNTTPPAHQPLQLSTVAVKLQILPHMLTINKAATVGYGHQEMKQKAKVGIFKLLSILIPIIIFLLLPQYSD
jgi:hypothetical protein